MRTRTLVLALAFVSVTLTPTPAPAGSQASGGVACPSSGAAPLSANRTPVSMLTIQNAYGNTGVVYVGGPDVSATSGVQLLVGDSYTFQPQSNSQPYDLSKTYIACTVAAETVVFVYEQ